MLIGSTLYGPTVPAFPCLDVRPLGLYPVENIPASTGGLDDEHLDQL